MNACLVAGASRKTCGKFPLDGRHVSLSRGLIKSALRPVGLTDHGKVGVYARHSAARVYLACILFAVSGREP